MDMASGDWQVAMSPDASWKVAFVTHDGLFQFRVVTFGLCNAPAMTPEALLRLTEVLEHLSSFGLQLKAKKCTFMQTEVAFLGYVVGCAGLACDPDKLSAVRAQLNKTGAPICGFCQILSPFHSRFCRFVGTTGGTDSQRDCLHVDHREAGCV